MGKWLPGARTGLHRLKGIGTVIIHTSRIAPFELHDQGSREVVWRDEHETIMEIMAIKRMLYHAGLGDIEIWTRPYKPPALVYVDDRGFKFEGDWDAVVEHVEGLVAQAPPQVAVKGSA
jgi:hypothetical protein